ncbi:glycoside hydrolase/deacetylase [Microthyrium microscopicum]|uniref:Glycoside hydrolase/deacetylase n=1 Tax=Microthyrium microscopicum TaxID=703497 RepID=A0A6A6UAI3_9PEZI|nr:glycoside hydrolase/deacetylase [Microthyrium microscopicum]
MRSSLLFAACTCLWTLVAAQESIGGHSVGGHGHKHMHSRNVNHDKPKPKAKKREAKKQPPVPGANSQQNEHNRKIGAKKRGTEKYDFSSLLWVKNASKVAAKSHPNRKNGARKRSLPKYDFSSLLWVKNISKVLSQPHPNRKNGAKKREIGRRQTSTDGSCGAGVGTCPAGQCCSASGWCGVGIQYCASPDCQLDYGPGCDANTIPPGTTTSGVARTQSTSPKILYGGAGIYHCTVPGTIAITYDDGPYNYTSNVLDLFDKYNAKATFFITGNNLGKGEIDDPSTPWPAIIKRMESSNHQIASHTWSHEDLSEITATQLQNQIYYNEMAFRNLLGYFPTYMRPPYSSCTSACSTFLGTAGYHICYFDLDTEDYLHNDPTQILVSHLDVTGNLSTGNNPKVNSWLSVSHDIDYETSYDLTEFMLKTFTTAGFNMTTIGDCLGDPKANWYRTAGGAAAFTPKASATSSAAANATGTTTDGSCGAANGGSCANSGFGNCCSASGWCGTGTTYCGDGCQVGYGTCGNSTATSTSAAPVSTKVSTDGTCGGTNGYTCTNSGFGNCCSAGGWCGSTSDYCGATCQTSFGTCGSSSVVSSAGVVVSSAGASAVGKASSVVGGLVSSAGTSASTTSATSKSSSVTSSSSAKTTSTTSSTTSTTSKTSSTTSSTAAASTLKVSTTGQCGVGTGLTCKGSTIGTCCIQAADLVPGLCMSSISCTLMSAFCRTAYGTC